MKIETKLVKKEYLKLLFYWFYSKPSVISISIVGLLMFSFSLLYFIGFNIPFGNKPYFQLIFGGLIIFYIPLLVFITVNKSFSSKGKLNEKIIYDFSEQKYSVVGESFKSESLWNDYHLVKETNNWFVLFQNKILIYAIPKASLEDNLSEFRNLIRNSKVKSKLKK